MSRSTIQFQVALRCGFAAILLYAAALAGGCAKATVSDVNRPYAKIDRTKPDFIIVQNFAVTPDDVQPLRGIIPNIQRDAAKQSEEEVMIGYAVSDVLAQHLVDELRSHGIDAYRADDHPRFTWNTATIAGYFMEVDEGDRTGRFLVGFGVGGSKLAAHVVMYQGDRPLADATVTTRSDLKPGLLPAIGLGAATGGIGAAAALNIGSSVGSEMLSGAIEGDAKRAAQAIAKEIQDAYVERHWK